jgi:hypothetical protein
LVRVQPGELPRFLETARQRGFHVLQEKRASASVRIMHIVRGGYVLHEGDELIDHERGTVHRYEGGRLVCV